MTEPIRLSELTRTFPRGEAEVRALRGVDLTIASGEFVALVGPSGSGKSTLLNLLGGLDSPSGGELWLDGLPLHSANEAERTRHRRDRVGFIFQSFNLLPRLTALENVALPLMVAGVDRANREARAAELLQRVGLGHRLHHYPTELSGGEQQRTAVARALVNNPALVLADEPTGNLDSATGAEVMALLQTLNREQGITLVLVTHDPDTAAYADRIVRLRDGQIEAIDTRQQPQPPAAIPAKTAPRTGSFAFADMVRSAFRNLGRRRVRNLLTAGGVLIGIITLVAMVSFGVGVQREVQRNFESVGLENIFVFPSFGEGGGDGFDPFADPVPEAVISPELVAEIAAMPEVVSVSPELYLPVGMDVTLLGDEPLPVYVEGTFENFRFGPGNTNEMLAGTGLDVDGRSGAVLISGLADQLLAEGERYDDLIGREIVLQVKLPRGETAQFPTTVVGVRNGFSTRSLNVGLAEREAMKAWWFGDDDILQTEGYDEVVVQAQNLGAVTAVTQRIEAMNLRVQSLQAILDVANQVLSLLQALLGSVGGLALLVAALGVANTMMMAIYERTREIGVLKAIGASPREIRRMFTIEAGLIGIIGGFFGVIFGGLLGRLVDWIAKQYLINEGVTGIGQLSVVPLWLALGSLAFAALIGILAGLYPAARAAKLDPIAALRHE